MESIDFAKLAYTHLRYANTEFALTGGSAAFVGTQAMTLRFAYPFGTSAPQLQIIYGGNTDTHNAHTSATDRFLIFFCQCVVEAAIAGTLIPLLNVLSDMLGADDRLPVKTIGVTATWHATDLEWTMPHLPIPANDQPTTIEHVAMAILAKVIFDVASGDATQIPRLTQRLKYHHALSEQVLRQRALRPDGLPID